MTSSPAARGPHAAWAIQIFSTDGPAGFGPAVAMLEIVLLGEELQVEESSDGLRSHLVVETRDDPAVLRSVRLAVEMAGVGGRFEQVHGPGVSHRSGSARPIERDECAA